MQARHTMIHINEKTPSCQIYILLKYMSVAPGSDSFFFPNMYTIFFMLSTSLCVAKMSMSCMCRVVINITMHLTYIDPLVGYIPTPQC